MLVGVGCAVVGLCACVGVVMVGCSGVGYVICVVDVVVVVFIN